MVTYERVKNDPSVRAYIEKSDQVMARMGYTDHSMAHTVLCAHRAGWLLEELDYPERTVELARIAALLHDIGNMINRQGHAHHGAALSFTILERMGMAPQEIAEVVLAIGHHDESSSQAITAINSALIIADKTDVRYTRVRQYNADSQDIHDRVNYAVKKTDLSLNHQQQTLMLDLTIDTKVSSVAEYFEIFLNRMLLCRKAAAYFDLEFKLRINNSLLI